MSAPVRQMGDDEIEAETAALKKRINELSAEKTRRLISLDGDIGRRQPRIGDTSLCKHAVMRSLCPECRAARRQLDLGTT